MTDGPLIVQSDKTLLLEVDHPLAKECRAAIAPFAELERSPEHVHTYRVTPLALWNAREAGHDAEQVVDALVRYSRYAVPQPLLVDVVDTMSRYGRLQLMKNPAHGLTLVSLDRAVLEALCRRFGGGPVGLSTLAVAVGEEPDTVETVSGSATSMPRPYRPRPQGRSGIPHKPQGARFHPQPGCQRG